MVEKIKPFNYNYWVQDTKKIRDLFEQGLPILNALGDSNRQKLMMLMLEGEPKSVGELAANMSLSRPSISHHLKILKDARVITEKRVGTRRYYHPITGEYIEPIQELLDEIKKFDEYMEKFGKCKLSKEKE